jgi:hypothetical protein
LTGIFPCGWNLATDASTNIRADTAWITSDSDVR